MEEVIRETVKSVPALALLAFLTFIFLKHLTLRDISLSKLLIEHAKMTELSNEVISLNTKSMAENTRAIDEMRRTLEGATVTIGEVIKKESK